MNSIVETPRDGEVLLKSPLSSQNGERCANPMTISMSNKNKNNPPATAELPIPPAAGVTTVSIPEIDTAIAKYERKKEARCSLSPDEIAAKKELTGLIYAHRAQLPVNSDGEVFYRHEGVDYALEEKLKRRKCDDESNGE